MDKIDIKSLSKSELGTKLTGLGEKPYRARQIFRWLYKAGVKSFNDMTDLPIELRELLKTNFHITRLSVLDFKKSSIDGTTKYLFKLEDGNTIEAVFLPERKRNTACLSSQVGCKYACSFCASSPFGFIRNLVPSEMLDEVIFLKEKCPSGNLTNLVFMGIGEGLDNYDNVLKAVRVFNDKDAFGIGARKITISTCGLIPGIERLKSERLQVELSVSLHSASDRIRSKLVPINKKYPLKELMAACKDYVRSTNRVITFEYILIKGVNSSRQDAVDLAGLVRGLKCKVNTISYNKVSPVRNMGASAVSNGVRAKDYEEPTASEAKAFVGALRSAGVNVTHRKSKGEDIDAGCGQLRIARL